MHIPEMLVVANIWHNLTTGFEETTVEQAMERKT